MTSPIDLRSDTVTRPTRAMREAMANAEVGDDVYGEDPTVHRLQERAAELLGKERALFVASGTMANQVAIRAHTEPGCEIILEESSHVFHFEAGAAAGISGAQVHPVRGDRGVLVAADVERAIRAEGDHFPRTALVSLENTHNRAGGRCYPIDAIASVAALARERGLAMHLDGARLLNAQVATGIAAAEYARHFDSVTLCLSKGLGCPVGSLVAGTATFIDRCRRARRMLGGGMRQAGVLCAAGLHALEHHVARLQADHDNAKLLAEGLAELPWVSVEPAEVETNMVFFEVDVATKPMDRLIAALAADGVLMRPTSPTRVRAVTHLDVSREEILRTLAVFREI